MRCLIHPGFIKTGTTLLQERLFPLHPQIAYLNEEEVIGHRDIKKSIMTWELLQLAHRGNERYESENLRLLLEEFIGQTDPGQTLVLSAEWLTSFEGNIGVKAERIYDLFASFELDIHILFVIRNQFDLIRSYFKRNGSKTFLVDKVHDHINWDRWLHYQFLPGHIEIQVLSGLYFQEIISYWEKLFGSDCVSVLLYEDLRFHFEIYCRNLASIIGIEPDKTKELLQNKKMNSSPDSIVRRVWDSNSRTYKELEEPLDFGVHEEQIIKMFGPGNGLLKKQYSLPLREYGYPVVGG